MKSIIIDTSALIAAILDEPEKARLVELTADVDLLAPESLHWEVGNAFSAMFKRGCFSQKDALAAIQIYQMIPVQFVKVDLEKSLEIACSRGIYAYDAYMIASAAAHKIPLLTLDNTFASNCSAII